MITFFAWMCCCWLIEEKMTFGKQFSILALVSNLTLFFSLFVGKLGGPLPLFYFASETLNGKSSGKQPLSQGMRGRGLTPGRLQMVRMHRKMLQGLDNNCCSSSKTRNEMKMDKIVFVRCICFDIWWKYKLIILA